MNELQELPELGVGIIYWPELEKLLNLDAHSIDVIEIEPQAYWFHDRSGPSYYKLDQRAFDHIQQLRQPKLVHGVGFPVGGSSPLQLGGMLPFRESIEALDASWASEHLSFNRIRSGEGVTELGFLLPPIQSRSSIENCVSNIIKLKQHIPVPFAFETGVSYLKRSPFELSDGSFFSAVATRADCGILLDVHNLWTNERNGRQAVLEVISELPLDRVIEIHLAGGEEYAGYWVDAHSGLVSPEVIDLASIIVPMLPNLKAIIYEVMPEYLRDGSISTTQLAEQIDQLHELWSMRCISPTVQVTKPVEVKDDPLLPSPETWEQALHDALVGHESPENNFRLDLTSDPGIGVLRSLIASARAGKLAGSLNLTIRMLLLSVGEQGVERIFEDFWAVAPPQQLTSEEAIDFAEYLLSSLTAAKVEWLGEVVNFELAAHRAVITGEAQRVSFSCDPELLFSALRKGQLPRDPTRGQYEVMVTPPE